MSNIVNAALISILSITNSSHPVLKMGMSLPTYTITESSNIVHEEYFNQTYMFSNPGNGNLRAIKVLLPFLDLFYDDNVIPIDHDVIIKNNTTNYMSYNPYYFCEVDSYKGYFESKASNIGSNLSACQYVKDYLISYFASIGYGTNQNNNYYDLFYDDNFYLEASFGTSMSLDYLLDEGYFVFGAFDKETTKYRFCLILQEADGIEVFDLDYGVVTSKNSLALQEVVAFKLNTSHYCSDNYYLNNVVKCLGCGSSNNVHHDHYTNQTTPEAFTHKFLCSLCNEMVAGEHNYTSMSYYNLMYHEKTCGDCGYVAREAHFGGVGGNSCPCRLTNI